MKSRSQSQIEAVWQQQSAEHQLLRSAEKFTFMQKLGLFAIFFMCFFRFLLIVINFCIVSCVCVPFSNEACTQYLYCGIFRCMSASSISTATSHSHFHFSLTHSSKNDINAVDMIFSHLLMWYLVLYYVPFCVGKCENHLFSSFHHGVSVVHICGVMETRGGRCACHIRWFYVVQSSG